jgi:hypothetical protein
LVSIKPGLGVEPEGSQARLEVRKTVTENTSSSKGELAMVAPYLLPII